MTRAELRTGGEGGAAAVVPFRDRDAVAQAAADAMAMALGDGGTFLATGGSTPGPAYDRLARLPLPWNRIRVAPTDERFVDPASDDSNEHLIRSRLLVGAAAEARFTPLRRGGSTPEADAAAAEPEIAALLPAAGMILGMGPDGHIGSLFPHAQGLAEHLDPNGRRLCVGVDGSPDKPEVPRISLTVRAFLACAAIVILITGEEKRALIEAVLAGNAHAPVAAILFQHRAPVRILWAP
ncbi:MAG TPA: 6-phosphogluconolactonase [Caulobacteraceae bacterium]|nr:6-phosphogluconolactonase [Caulobacteraceae bacterium]